MICRTHQRRLIRVDEDMNRSIVLSSILSTFMTYTEDDIIDEPMEPIKKDSEKVEFCKEIFPYLKFFLI